MADQPLEPKHRRLALYDPALLPPETKGRARARTAHSPSGADRERIFAGTLRTANAALRALLPDEAQLRRYGLPVWRSEADLARALGISVRELRFYSIHRRADRISHYV